MSGDLLFRIVVCSCLVVLGCEDAPETQGDAQVNNVADSGGEDAADTAAMDLGGGEDAGGDECLPTDDSCPEGQYCQYRDRRLTCIDNGAVEPDPQFHSAPPCPDGTCSRGGICFSDTGTFSSDPSDARCFETCDPGFVGMSCSEPGCCTNGRHTCWQAFDEDGESLPFGLCHY